MSETLGVIFMPIGVRFRADGETFWFDENELKLIAMQEEIS
jgi:hypothetical protein